MNILIDENNLIKKIREKNSLTIYSLGGLPRLFGEGHPINQSSGCGS